MDQKFLIEIRKLFEKLVCCKVNFLLSTEGSVPMLTGEDALEIRSVNSQSFSNALYSTQELQPIRRQKSIDTVRKVLPVLIDASTDHKASSIYNKTLEMSPSLTDRILAAEPTSPNFSKSVNDHLFRAVESNDEEMVRLLSDKQQSAFKIDLNCQKNDGSMPLHIASRLGFDRICSLLAKHGADVDALDGTGKTALHLATRNGHYKTVQALVRAGARLHVQDELGNTSLHYAVAGQDARIIKYFMDRFPDVGISNCDGITAQDLISLHGVSIRKESFSVAESLPSDEKDEKLCQNDFEAIQVLGRGSFAEVYLVKMISSGMLFAMKVLRKEKMLKQNVVRYAITERNVLTRVTHPFIAKLNYAFQSEDKLYLVLDYYSGGPLTYYISKEKHFTEDISRFYLSELVLALEELHKNQVIYRDLKPDNVLIDANGHAVLTDFGLAKQHVGDDDLASSFCGSLAYLAPEMVKRTGHGRTVDWYLLGVLFYEMLVGFPPFYSVNREQMFKNIENAKVRVPARVSAIARDLIKNLMKKNPDKRLGALKDAEEVKAHPFFADVNWDDVIRKNKDGPLVPKNRIDPGFVPKFHMKEKAPEESDLRYLSNWTFIKN
jgi:protein-serine/threonine kinase